MSIEKVVDTNLGLLASTSGALFFSSASLRRRSTALLRRTCIPQTPVYRCAQSTAPVCSCLRQQTLPSSLSPSYFLQTTTSISRVIELLPQSSPTSEVFTAAKRATPAHTDCYSHLAQGKFHRSFTCSRTGSRVTYADIGDPAGAPAVYFLPSGCSWLMGIVMDDVAHCIGIRVIAMDRPGSGGTRMCVLNERVRITCGAWPLDLERRFKSLKPLHQK